jgi:anti-sigma regulatory factor (Ser/Thr protein kinase)
VPGESLQDGLERLRALADRTRDPDALCAAMVSEAANAPREDDVAVLVARLAPLPDRLVTSWPADAAVLNDMRHMLQRWLEKWGATEDEVYDITVAVQEACANAIEHAYAPGSAAFDLEVAFEDGTVTATIRDRGRWREPRGTNRGRGLQIMDAVMSSVDVERTETGNVVTLWRHLERMPA